MVQQKFNFSLSFSFPIVWSLIVPGSMMKAVPQNGVCSAAPVGTPSTSDNGNTPVSQTRSLCLPHFSCFSSIRVRGNVHNHHLSSFGALTDLTLAYVSVLESRSECGKGESSSNK